jgi:crotonobetainyl-CoA:carnitine CoA-transferase CaiB-like acyl-CoA transferase
VLGKPEMIRKDRDEREQARQHEVDVLTAILKEKTADEWEAFFQPRHVPAARVRTMGEALRDPHLDHRGLKHLHEGSEHIPGALGVPVAAFQFADGGPRVDSPPPMVGQHNEEILSSLGYDKAAIAKLRAEKII